MIARLFALVLACLLLSCGGSAGYQDIFVPAPITLRTDLRFGYFGAYGDQATQTKGSVNLFWEAHFEGDAKALDNILTAKTYTVLSCGDQVFEKFQATGRNWRVRADAAARLRAYFQFLHDGGGLQYVRDLVPFDEPNTNVASSDELRKSVAVLKAVAAEFTDLSGVRLAVIYAYKPLTYDAIELFDDVGIDDYSQLSEILTNGSYQQLVARLRPDQHTILMPGGAFGQNPTPFVNFAQFHKEVGMVLAFVWFPAPSAADVGAIPGHPWVGIGEPGNPLRDVYLSAGRTIVGAH